MDKEVEFHPIVLQKEQSEDQEDQLIKSQHEAAGTACCTVEQMTVEINAHREASAERWDIAVESGAEQTFALPFEAL